MLIEVEMCEMSGRCWFWTGKFHLPMSATSAVIQGRPRVVKKENLVEDHDFKMTENFIAPNRLCCFRFWVRRLKASLGVSRLSTRLRNGLRNVYFRFLAFEAGGCFLKLNLSARRWFLGRFRSSLGMSVLALVLELTC